MPFTTTRGTYAEKVVKVVLILIIVEMTTVFTDLVTFGITLWLENVSWLEQDLAGELVNLLEPVPQFLVPVGVFVQHIDRVFDLVGTPAVGEPLEKRPQLPGSLLECRILHINTINYCVCRHA